jgi:hypothetical protein
MAESDRSMDEKQPRTLEALLERLGDAKVTFSKKGPAEWLCTLATTVSEQEYGITHDTTGPLKLHSEDHVFAITAANPTQGLIQCISAWQATVIKNAQHAHVLAERAIKCL